mmetsp:Transcript_25889/g.24716  ORF Transcript_25889/g.24716 Transcript_25889/m.24716 type:complete len:654 (+) Transcript_25889:102-2063(+)|eukprot:CAMPEP_0119046548 /NCGR_PEP_ID=MMETSP1177-20130426/47436_1 /TAXON_ID=2985 /ORGANISM="Ochromonas sp, Strain CCMP1899" /LENGTH=653 /DNA_ID=CAMNT_0007019867 /DNA_START=74 /DNA_END=2035 /DNA_ORIENTATION=+
MREILLISILLAYRINSFSILSTQNEFSKSGRCSVIAYALLPGKKLLKSSSASVAGKVSTNIVVKKTSKIVRKAEIVEKDEVESTDEQLKNLETAANANRFEWEAQLKAKLDEWKEMKANGILDTMGDEVDEDVIIQMDSMSKRLMRKQRGISKEKEASDKAVAASLRLPGDEAEKKEGPSQEQMMREFKEKFVMVSSSKEGSALGVYSLLNEMKDKNMLDFDSEFLEEVVLACARLESSSIAIAAYKLYQKWLSEKKIIQFNENFDIIFVNTCFSSSSSLTEAGNTVMNIVKLEKQISNDVFLPGLTCAAIYEISDKREKKRAKKLNNEGAEAAAIQALEVLKLKIKEFEVCDINPVIRALGRRRLVSPIFELLDCMRAQGMPPDDESLEFLANALVVTVGEESKSKTMKDLPEPNMDMPEVVFAGRSNVGKSSLVNFLVNRKALASISPTPGHTTQFHFFAVNKERVDLPSFYLVDVPGLGYAEATDGTQDSWRSLLERYLTIRDSLGAVFHLIDSRHQITPTDEMMMEIVGRASASRKAAGRKPFLYTVILTKTDKASDKGLAKTERDVRIGTRDLALILKATIDEDNEELNIDNEEKEEEIELSVVEKGEQKRQMMSELDSLVPILKTSSLSRIGRDDVWKQLQSVIGY